MGREGGGAERETKLRKEQEPETQQRVGQGEEKSNRQFAVLPFMKGVTKEIQRAFKTHDIRLCYKAGFTVRTLWSSQRTLMTQVSRVVLSIRVGRYTWVKTKEIFRRESLV